MITRAWFASLLLATSLAAGTSMPPCDDASVESWIANMRERLLSFDLLGRHAVERFGTPTACHGEVNAEFDGMEFGRVRLEFSEGAVL